MAEISTENLKEIEALEKESKQIEEGFEAFYVVIGKNFYEKAEGCQAAIDEAVAKLDEGKEKIHQNYLQTLRLKGIKFCPNCETIIEDDSVFCGECGTRVEEVEQVDENSVLCGRCGAKNDKEKKFCGVCGQKLESIVSAEEVMVAVTETATEVVEAVQEAAVATEETVVETVQTAVPVFEEVLSEPEPEFKFCPECGTKLPISAGFCAECGTKMA